MEDKTYTLVLNQPMLNAIAMGLGELPFKIAHPVVAEIERQLNQKPEAPAAPETPVP